MVTQARQVSKANVGFQVRRVPQVTMVRMVVRATKERTAHVEALVSQDHQVHVALQV